MFMVPIRLELWLLWQLIDPIDLYWEKRILTFFSVSYLNPLGIFEFFCLVVGGQKRVIFVKMFKILLRNHKGDEAKTWHQHMLKANTSTEVVFFVLRSDKNSGCYGSNSFHRLIMGKMEDDNFCQVIGNI